MRINLIFFQLNIYFYLHELFMHTQNPPPTYKQRKKKKNQRKECNALGTNHYSSYASFC